MDGMHLNHLELDITFRAAQDLAFFDLVFIQIKLGVAFRAFNHGLASSETQLVPAGVLYNAGVKHFVFGRVRVTDKREYPDRPVVGVGGVVIEDGRAMLIRRGTPPLEGQWSIPGGTLELGETLTEGARRELREETGLDVEVLELIEVFERIFPGDGSRPQYHFVIVDYLCRKTGGALQAGGDATDVAQVREEDLERYALTVAATRVLKKAFAMTRARDSK